METLLKYDALVLSIVNKVMTIDGAENPLSPQNIENDIRSLYAFTGEELEPTSKRIETEHTIAIFDAKYKKDLPEITHENGTHLSTSQ